MRDVLVPSGVSRLALALCLFLVMAPCLSHAAAAADGGDSIATAAGDMSVVESDDCSPGLQPFSVSMVGSHETVDGALGVALSGRYAYVADGLDGLQILDVGEPTAPVLVASFDTPGYAQGVAIVGDYAFVADGPGGLQIINISTPFAPAYTSSCTIQGFTYGVAIRGNYAYVGGGGGGLHVINVGNPSSPQWTGSYDVCSTTWGVAINGDYAYVAAGSGGLKIVDISNPLSPALVGCYETRCKALGVAVTGNFAYVAGGSSGLQMVSISDPTSLMLVAKCQYPDFAYGLAVLNNYAYVAGGANGLQVMQVRAAMSIDDPRSGPPSGLTNLSEGSGEAPVERAYENSLLQNFPNPFVSNTQIAFVMNSAGPVSLCVFDATGRMVRELVKENRQPNRYVEEWDGKDNTGRSLAAGMYFCRLQLPGWSDVKKIALAR